MAKQYIEVAYIDPSGEQYLEELEYKQGMTIKEAVSKTSFYSKYNYISSDSYKAGIWSEPKDLGTVLEPKDRVEIYHDLEVDPKLRRRIKAKEQGFDLKNNRKK